MLPVGFPVYILLSQNAELTRVGMHARQASSGSSNPSEPGDTEVLSGRRVDSIYCI